MRGFRVLDSHKAERRISMVIPAPHGLIRTQGPELLLVGMAEAAICNPIYAGIPPYPPLVSDEEWIAAARRVIEQDGIERFLANMLYLLRVAMLFALESDREAGDPESHTTH
jgi:hypothetical protein